MNPLPIHPYCDLFPDIDGEEFGAFVKSIKENGLQVPIDEYKSQVIDGKNRQRACVLADVTPIYKVWSPPRDCQDIDAAILAFIKSRNLARRHFTPGQKASMANKLSQIRQGDHKVPQKTAELSRQANLPVRSPAMATQAEAAKEFKVSPRSVRTARHVQRHAAPEVAKAVEQGTMTLNAAEATIPKKPQVNDPSKPQKPDIPVALKPIFAWREKFRAYEKLHSPAIAELAIGFAHEAFEGGVGGLDHKAISKLLDDIHGLLMPWQPEKVCKCGGEAKCKSCDGRGWTRKG